MKNRIKDLRKELGKTQSDIAKILKVSDRAIGHYENGDRDIDTDTLSKIANFFDVSIDYLLGKTDIKRPNLHIIDTAKQHFDLSKSDLETLTKEQKNAIKTIAQTFIKENLNKTHPE